MINRQYKRFKAITNLAIILGFVVIVLGAFTRLADAGLGCPDWPGCYGHLLWPSSVEEVSQANQAWPQTPVEHDKTWPEMVHRYAAASLGLLSLILVFLALKTRQYLPVRPTLPIIILVAVIIQGLFGMWTVTLKLWPQVVTGHLLGGFTVLSLFWWLRLKLSGQRSDTSPEQRPALRSVKPWLWLTLIMVIMQIALGGWTTSNYAAVACPDFPTCQGSWWPAADFAAGFNFFQEVGPNYLGGLMDNQARIAIHLSHRIGALVCTLLILLCSYKLFQVRLPKIREAVIAWCLVLVAQLVLGLSNIVFNFPLSVAVAHNAIGALLLLKTLRVVFLVRCYTVLET